MPTATAIRHNGRTLERRRAFRKARLAAAA